jgi:hypothetical protein
MDNRRVPFWAEPVAILFIIVAAWWYFFVFDTAQGKCGRGDYGACVVWQAQQAQQGR